MIAMNHVTFVDTVTEDNRSITNEYQDYITFDDGVVTIHDYKGVGNPAIFGSGFKRYLNYEVRNLVLGEYNGNKITFTKNAGSYGYEYGKAYIKDGMLYIHVQYSYASATLMFDLVQ